MAPYSMDLRTRVLADCDGGLAAKEVAAKFRVSRSWVNRLVQRRRETGEVGPRPQQIFRKQAFAGQEDRLRYHRQIYETERKRDATLIDLRIENETAALARFRERYDETLFNLRAREATNVHPKEGDELSGKFHEPTTEFLQKELARLELEIRASETRLKMLEYKRAVRDSQYRLDLSNQTRSETFDVSDLLRRYAPDRLVEQIRETVDPPSWNRPHARLEIQDSTLIVSQTAPALEKIRAHLDQLRRQ